MALVQATMKATILSEMNTVYGAPEDAAKAEEFAEFMSQVLLKILTNQAVVSMSGGGVDTGGDSLVTNVGAIS